MNLNQENSESIDISPMTTPSWHRLADMLPPPAKSEQPKANSVKKRRRKKILQFVEDTTIATNVSSIDCCPTTTATAVGGTTCKAQNNANTTPCHEGSTIDCITCDGSKQSEAPSPCAPSSAPELMSTFDLSDNLSVADSYCPSILLPNTISDPNDTGTVPRQPPQTLQQIVTFSLWSDQVPVALRGMKDLLKLLARDEEKLRQRRPPPSQHLQQPSNDDQDEDSTKLEFLWLGGHLAVLCAMQRHPTSSDIQIQGGRILFKLLKNVSVYWMSLLGTMGAVRTLVAAMQHFYGNLAVHESCSRTLYRLLSCQRNAEEFCGMHSVGIHGGHGIAVLLRRIEMFPKDRQTQIDVCNLLKKLCAWEEIRLHLMEQGVVSVMVPNKANMTRSGTLPDDRSLVSTSKASTTTTTTASMSDDSEGSEGNFDLSSSNSSIVEVTGSLGLRGLSVVLENEEEEEVVVDGSGLDSVTLGPVIWKFVHPRSSWHRRRITNAVPPSQDCVISDDRIISLIEALTEDLWDEDLEVVESALEQIDILIRLRQSRLHINYAKVLMEIGGPLALVSFLRHHRSNSALQRLGFLVLRVMAGLEGLHVLFSDLNAIQVVLDGMKAHPSEPKVQKAGFRVLLVLLKGPSFSTQLKASMVLRFLQADGLTVLVQAMFGFPNKVHIQKSTCKLLYWCAKSHPDVLHDDLESLAGALEAILMNHTNHPKAVAAASKVQKALLRESPMNCQAVKELFEEHPLIIT